MRCPLREEDVRSVNFFGGQILRIDRAF